MPANIMIFLWSHSSVWNLSLQTRLFKLDNRIAEANNRINANLADLTSSLPFKGIFLAPEYYFTRQAVSRQPLSEADRLLLETQLLALSKKYPNIVIVPGTIFYEKPLVRDAGSALNKFDPATGQRTLAKTTGADRRDRAVKNVKKYISSIPQKRTNQDWVQHSWVSRGYQAGAHAVPSIHDITASLRDTTKNPTIVKNAAYILLDGKRIAKYDKQSDFGEALGASPDNMAFLPGAYKQCPEIKGYRFGAEICFDHANGMLARRNVTPLHFHFCVSDWATTTVGNMAMTTGGFFAHASTNYNESAIYIRNAGGNCQNITADTTYWKVKATPWSRLDGYVVPLPPPIVPPRRP